MAVKVLTTTTCFGPQVAIVRLCSLLIAAHLRYIIKYLVVFMTVVHTYSYIVVDTQRGCHTLKYLAVIE